MGHPGSQTLSQKYVQERHCPTTAQVAQPGSLPDTESCPALGGAEGTWEMQPEQSGPWPPCRGGAGFVGGGVVLSKVL